jgi:hypothetical protein
MARPTLLTLAASAIAGTAAALLTGLVDVTPSGGLVGATWYGYPLAWLRRLIVAPQHNPLKVDGLYLLLDIVLWSSVVAVIGLSALLLYRLRRRA